MNPEKLVSMFFVAEDPSHATDSYGTLGIELLGVNAFHESLRIYAKS